MKNVEDFAKHHKGHGKEEAVGVHLEGPFINKKRKGEQPKEYILTPNIELFKRWQNLTDVGIKVVTFASELENGI